MGLYIQIKIYFMSSDKDKNKDYDDKGERITMDKDASSVSEFVRRPLPSRKEVKRFEDRLFRRSRAEREEKVRDSLSEIYKDDKGNMVNVKKIDKKKKGGIFSCLLYLLLLLAVAGGIAAAVFYFFFSPGGDIDDVEISIEGEEKVVANKENSYKIKYNNPSNADLGQVELGVKFPDNFVMTESDPSVDHKEAGRSFWVLEDIPQGEKGEVEIKGKMLGQEKDTGVIVAEMSYVPSNFSSEFKKEDSLNIKIDDLGLDFDFDADSNVLVGEEKELNVDITPGETNHLEDLIMEIGEVEYLEILDGEVDGDSASLEEKEERVWELTEIGSDPVSLKFNYRFTDKEKDEETIPLIFKKREDDREWELFKKDIDMEVVKSDMDLGLVVNGSQDDQSVNFGEKLNYSISYTNKGEKAMENIMIMAVLDSNSLDWTTLDTNNSPSEEGNTLIWTREEIPQLEKLEPGEGGDIDFSIDVSPFSAVDEDDDHSIKNYAQFVIGDDSSFDQATSASSSIDHRSNVINNSVNSDLRINEEVRYFSEDNIPLGTGPFPPQVDEETTFKVYWTLKNNLHELNDTKVSVELPDHVKWEGKKKTSVGSVEYKEDNHEVIWKVGKMPLSVYRADAEFNIGITPETEDENKVMVLTPGAVAEAFDTETEATVTVSSDPKTTKLEDDDIAERSGDGQVDN